MNEILAAVAGERPISKAEFARRRNVDRSRVTQWIAEKKIDGTAISGEGREAKIVESIACAQLAARLDPMQRMGNGLTTNLNPAQPHQPVAADEPKQNADDLRMLAPASAARPQSPDAAIDAELKRGRLEQLQRANRVAARQEAEAAGLLTDAAAARAQFGRLATRIFAIFEGAMPELASALAARFDLPRRRCMSCGSNSAKPAAARRRHCGRKRQGLKWLAYTDYDDAVVRRSDTTHLKSLGWGASRSKSQTLGDTGGLIT